MSGSFSFCWFAQAAGLIRCRVGRLVLVWGKKKEPLPEISFSVNVFHKSPSQNQQRRCLKLEKTFPLALFVVSVQKQVSLRLQWIRVWRRNIELSTVVGCRQRCRFSIFLLRFDVDTFTRRPRRTANVSQGSDFAHWLVPR